MNDIKRINSQDNARYSLWQVISHARKFYNKIPLLGRIASPLVYCIRIYPQLRLKLWKVTGNERTSGMQLSILYATNYWGTRKSQNINYLNGLAYGKSFSEKYQGRAWLWNIPKVVEEIGDGCSLVVVQIQKSFRRLMKTYNWFYIPQWVGGEVSIPIDPAFLKKHTVKMDLRKIRVRSLGFEVTQDPNHFNDFYHNMYVPFINKAHGARAFVQPYEKMRAKFKNCDLLLITKQEERIAGFLIIYEKSGPRLWVSGVRDANREYIKDGALGALYHFSFLYLKDKGFAKVNLGLSKAFLRDGVLQYKKKWSQKIVATSTDCFALKIISYPAAASAFLQENPFIFENRGTLNGAVFVDADRPLSAKELRNIVKLYYINGLSKLFIYHLLPTNAIKQENIPSEFSERIVLRSAGDMT